MSTASRLSIPSVADPFPAATRIPQPSKWRAIFPLPEGKALGILISAIAILLVTVGAIEFPVLNHTHGNVLFPRDDAYVNITVARNLAFYKVWGVSKYAFQSAASSLLYPIALAPVFFIFGAHLIIPLIVNFLLGAYFLLMFQRTLIRFGLSLSRQFLVLVAAMALTLLPLLVVSGMEYTLQLLVVFLFIDALAQAAGKSQVMDIPPSAEKIPTVQKSQVMDLRRVYLFGLLAVAARYEDLLIIALAALVLYRQKGWRPAIKLTAIAVAPIVVFGVISLIKKSYFVPNSMLLASPPIPILIITIIAVAIATWLILRQSQSAPQTKPQLFLLLLALPFTARNATTLAHFQRDSNQVYDEQYLTAGFVHLYYYKSTVAVNQPGAGAISYFSDGRKLDFTGAASSDVIKMKHEHPWSPLYADSLGKLDGIRVAIVADPWFSPGQLPKWTRIATWGIVTAAGDPVTRRTINFYATNDYDTTRLRQNLHDYQHLLPPTVSVRYY